jgi:uncharacterized membrane protein YgcG
MDFYGLTKDDRDAVLELAGQFMKDDPTAGIPTRVKTAFTRRFNQDHFEFRKISEKIMKSDEKAKRGGGKRGGRGGKRGGGEAGGGSKRGRKKKST